MGRRRRHFDDPVAISRKLAGAFPSVYTSEAMARIEAQVFGHSTAHQADLVLGLALEVRAISARDLRRILEPDASPQAVRSAIYRALKVVRLFRAGKLPKVEAATARKPRPSRNQVNLEMVLSWAEVYSGIFPPDLIARIRGDVAGLSRDDALRLALAMLGDHAEIGSRRLARLLAPGRPVGYVHGELMAGRQLLLKTTKDDGTRPGA